MDSEYKTEKIDKKDFDFRRYNLFQKILYYFKTFGQWAGKLIRGIIPGKLFKKGAGIAATILVVLVSIVLGVFVKTGLWIVLDIPAGILLVILLALALGLAVGIILRVCYEITRIISWRGVMAMGALAALFLWFGLPLPLAIGLSVVLVLAVALLGGTIALFFDINFKYFSWPKKIWIFVVIVLIVLFHVYVVDWLLDEGSDQHLSTFKTPALDNKHLNLTDPGQPGSFATIKMSYGSGIDKRRQEFGKEAQVKTQPVDGSKFLSENSPFKMKLRKSYWGFDTAHLPLNAVVWFPKGQGPFPLILVVHGSARMEIPSHRGFEYMGPVLASRGFIVAAIDENFLNPSWHGRLKGAIPARAWLILQHLKLWHTWHTTSTNPFYGIVDLNNIGLLGHGSGGEAAAVATLFNRLSRMPEEASVRFEFNFRIRSVMAVAPTEGNYRPAGGPVKLTNLNYLLLQGGHDAALYQCCGERQFHRVTFKDSQYWLKTRIYAQRANHSRFNAVWSEYDLEFPMNLILNRKPLLSPADQHSLLKMVTIAFMEATLKKNTAYLPLLRDIKYMRGWLPEDIYLTRFQDSHFLPLCNFEEDVDITTGSLKGSYVMVHHVTDWREGDMPMRKHGWSQNRVLFLGWQPLAKSNRIPSITIQLPENGVDMTHVDRESLLVCSMADGRVLDSRTAGGARPMTASVELITRERNVKLPLQRFGALTVPLKARFTKFRWDNLFCPAEPEWLLQTFEIPLAAFLMENPQLDLKGLKAIRFSFDGSAEGLVILDDIGFAKYPPRVAAPVPDKK